MRIKRFETNGFGCLKGSYQFGSRPSTLIIEKNEKGKSTLVAGILAALYGLEGDGSQTLPERERFRPMRSKGFDVTLSLRVGDREYRITRDFNTEAVGVWDEKTGQEITTEFKGDDGEVRIGEGLIDLSREGFLKTSLFRQNEIQTLSEASDIAEKIEAMIDTLSGETTTRQAIFLLQEARDRYGDNTSIETEIERMRRTLGNYKKEWQSLEKGREILDERSTHLIDLTQRNNQLRESLDRADYAAMLSQKQILEERISHHEKSQRHLQELESELESLKGVASFPADREEDLTEALRSLGDTDQRVHTLQRDLEEKERTIQRPEKRIHQRFKRIESLTDESFSEISEMMTELKGDLSTLREVRTACGGERKKIVQEGYALKHYPELRRRLEAISAEERAIVARYHEGSGIKRNEIRSLKSDIRRHERRVERTEAELVGRGKSRNRGILFGCLLWLIAVGIHVIGLSPYRGMLNGFAIDWVTLQATLGAIGLIAVLWGVMSGWRGRKERTQALSIGLERIESLRMKKDRMERKLEGERTQMEALASRVGFRSPEQLCERLTELERLEERTIKLRSLLACLKEIKSRIAPRYSKIAEYMEGVGEKPDKASWGVIVRFYKRAEAYRKAESQIKARQGEVLGLKEKIQKAHAEKKEKEQRVASILKACQILWDRDPDRATAAFREKLDRFRRFVQIRDELIPKARLEQMPPDICQNVLPTLGDLKASIKEIEKRYPGMKSRDVSQTQKPSSETVEGIKAEMEKISDERGVLRNEITQFLERYRCDNTRLREEIRICEQDLERSLLFEAATRLAIQHLENVQKDLHHQCAGFLTQKAKAVLAHLNPSCDVVEINTDLSFSIRHKGLRTTLDQRRLDGLLSVGARDQVYLALRLAISRYLSTSGVHLPFIFDDALITSDDDRFLGSMNFVLKELAEAHQVIVLTCHEKRHRWWLDHLPEECNDRIHIARLEP